MEKPKKRGSRSKTGITGKLVVLMILLFQSCTLASTPEIWVEGTPKHHVKGGFRNYPPVPKPGSATIGFYLRRFWGSFTTIDVPADHTLTEKEAIQQYHQNSGIDSITWIGHATFLIRINGKTILTDPFVTNYASPIKYLGPKRFVQPGISLENLPQVDIIVVSHNHLDHLDAETVELLKGKENIQVYVPLGLKPFFAERGYQTITEMDWYQSAVHEDIRFTALPAVHYSQRSTRDKNRTLWCAWSFASASGKYFFSGDTSYSASLFEEIGRKDGPYDLAMISIGAYKVRESGPESHLTPEEAILAARKIGAGAIVGMHWGTIELSDEPHWEPPIRFNKAAKKSGLSSDYAWILKIGETRPLLGSPKRLLSKK
jgi:N-acyl-phosphatidylethanolamine-hydrolysing phospholipase D